jgi:hypothetical protein
MLQATALRLRGFFDDLADLRLADDQRRTSA